MKDFRHKRCADCGHHAPLRFCPKCGQRQDVDHRDLKALVRDFFGDVFTFDSKVFRSLRWLLLRPGQLSVEYIAGRRTRYVTPLRLYLFFSIVFVLSLTQASELAQSVGEHSIRVNMDGPRAAAGGAESVLGKMPTVILLLVPVFALLLKLTHRRRRDLVLMDHLVVALHFHAGFFVVASLVLLGRVGIPLSLGALVWVLGSLYWTLRRVYEDGPGWAVTKTLVVLSVYGTIAFTTSLLAAAWLLNRRGGGVLVF